MADHCGNYEGTAKESCISGSLGKEKLDPELCERCIKGTISLYEGRALTGQQVTKSREFGLVKYASSFEGKPSVDFVSEDDPEYNIQMTDYELLVQVYVYNRKTGFSAIYRWPSKEAKYWRDIAVQIEKLFNNWKAQ